jgi:cysteine desulfurase
MRFPIYLDNHSTTRVDPRVVDSMFPYFSQHYGNAASKHHQFGWTAEAAVEHARTQIARLIGSDTKEVIFTSGATESINLALKGVSQGYASRGNHIITAQTEHKAVLDTCKRLEEQGFQVTYLPVDKYGIVSPDDVSSGITVKTILVTIMLANNEIGTIGHVGEIGAMCRNRGIIFHSDATQAVGRIPVDVSLLNVDLLSFSAHKMYGPKGVGALYIRRAKPQLKVVSQIEGGGHERGLRSGTLNVPAIVGFGKAAELARSEMVEESKRVSVLRDRLANEVTTGLDETRVNGHATQRLPNNANITFAHVEADRLIMDMKEIAVSTGSACTSASPQPSHVLRAIGLSDADVHSSIRFGLGRFTTEEEIEYTIRRVVETAKAARQKWQHRQLA